MTSDSNGPGTPPPLPPNPAQPPRPNDYQQRQFRQPPPPPPPYTQPPRSPRWAGTIFQSCLVAGCATIIAPLVLLSGFVLLIGYAVGDSLETTTAAFGSADAGPSQLFRERLLRRGDSGTGSIAVINLQGAIDGGGSPLEGTGKMWLVASQLRAAAENDDVRAVLLQVDSPGGGLTASDLLYNEVLNVRGKGKVVVVWAGGLMASGGYYVAAAGDSILASPTATVGSIGVIMQHYQVDGLMKLLGLKADPIMAGESKDIGSPFREMTEEERALLQSTVDHAHKRFIDIVAKGRGMAYEDAAKLATGVVFTADEAVKNGLIDEICYIDDAVGKVEELVGEENMRIFTYRRILSFADVFSDSGRGIFSILSRLEARTDATPRLSAEWTGE